MLTLLRCMINLTLWVPLRSQLVSQTFWLGSVTALHTHALEKWSARIGSDTFFPTEGSVRCSGNS